MRTKDNNDFSFLSELFVFCAETGRLNEQIKAVCALHFNFVFNPCILRPLFSMPCVLTMLFLRASFQFLPMTTHRLTPRIYKPLKFL